MKTIIWKELRENLKWAMLALLGLTIAEVYALYQQSAFAIDPYGNLTLCSSAFLLATALGCSLVGAGLGALQILPELRRDQWAALLHRPLSRRTILFGKIAAGLLLYFFATIPPLVISVIYVAWPGQFAVPFLPGMVRPGASDLLLGATSYFLALLVSLHRGRWFGKRSLLGLSFLPVLAFHDTGPGMVLAPVIASLVLLVAACGAMNHHGTIKDYPRPSRFSMVFLLFVGVEVMTGFVLFGLSLVPVPGRKASYNSFREVVLTTDGKLMVRIHTFGDSTLRLTDLRGTPVTDERYIGNDRGNVFTQFIPITWYFKHDRAMETASIKEQPRGMRKYLALANTENLDGPEAWYFLPGGNYFEGFDRSSRRRLGLIDRGGFRTSTVAPQPFAEPLASNSYNSQPYLFWTDKDLYMLDFSERSATTLFTTENDTIYGVAVPRARRTMVLYIAIALEKEIQILDPHGVPVCTLPYPHDPTIWTGIYVATVPGGNRIFVRSEPRTDQLHPTATEAARPTWVDEFDLHGKIVHSDSLAPKPESTNSAAWVGEMAVDTLPLAPAAVAAVMARFLESPGDGVESVPWQEIAATLPLPVLFVIGGVSLATAICAWFWGLRAGLPAESLRRWTLFVFCFGLPGLIVFRLAAGWPARIPCPHCGRQRSVEADECPVCHQNWPAPEPNGTEIFHRAAEGLS